MSEPPPVPVPEPPLNLSLATPFPINGEHKNTEKPNNNDSMNIQISNVEGTKRAISYKGMVTGDLDETMQDDEDIEERGEDGHSQFDLEGMKVEECMEGEYECPRFVLSAWEEKRIHRPWRRGVIVKLLGRRIGYKALETRLKQMCVRKGIINIIDLSNDYYLVAFTYEEDKNAALVDGPWFIYDHYLTVKDWSPDFHPERDSIENVAVWIRISGLQIEYYDPKVLSFIGDRVGKSVKVDKNTLKQERGKYARICVEVNLTKPLLAMFTIKGRRYKIEYEGLHLLCLKCGKFGHYKEGCPTQTTVIAPQAYDSGRFETIPTSKEQSIVVQGKVTTPKKTADYDEGPWQVVQKPKRGRKPPENKKGNQDPQFNAGNEKKGSRFSLLMTGIGESSGVDKFPEKSMEVEKETMGSVMSTLEVLNSKGKAILEPINVVNTDGDMHGNKKASVQAIGPWEWNNADKTNEALISSLNELAVKDKGPTLNEGAIKKVGEVMQDVLVPTTGSSGVKSNNGKKGREKNRARAEEQLINRRSK
ncbi:uncharacterized protein LOC131598601 [Vicia villosa]|uniref:uncharacterized protein LOC131598601 n=1 Tax=Vicia villosa TaxID=3911 RepID=UPI00273C8F46|nr:uncharacterized protein LOC131598601 [Vicia villosa]